MRVTTRSPRAAGNAASASAAAAEGVRAAGTPLRASDGVDAIFTCGKSATGKGDPLKEKTTVIL